jgi:predicted TIM-barrel fold metal-dependent hydrolase
MATKKESRELGPLTVTSNTLDTLAHAAKYKDRKKFDEFLIVDIDAHVSEGMFWDELTDRIDSDVWKYNAKSFKERGPGILGLSNAAPGLLYQGVNGRIPHQERLGEAVEDKGRHKQVTLARRAMDAMGIDYMTVFPTPMLTMGVHPQPEVEVMLGQAYNRWLTEKVLPEDEGLLGFLYLPFNDPASCPKMVEEFGERKGVMGFSVTSTRYRPVHHNSYMRLYAMLEERGLPLIFHAGFNWEDGSMAQLNRFMTMHALSFVHCNLVHMCNWVINGLPERFPKLKVLWIESGLAWIPYLMQRLDSEYMMRTSEAPLLKRKPSEYMKEMYYSSQPIELHHPKLVEATFEAINAETQLLYASDWPHWDFDTPSAIYNLAFLNEKQKRNILGGNAARLLNLKDPYAAKAAAE